MKKRFYIGVLLFLSRESLFLRENTFITTVKPISHRKRNTQKTVTQHLISLDFKCSISLKKQTLRHQSVLVMPINSRDSYSIEVFGHRYSYLQRPTTLL